MSVRMTVSRSFRTKVVHWFYSSLSLSLCQGKQVQLRSNHALNKEASSIIINGQRILCWVNDRAGRLLGSALTGQEWSIWVRFNLQRGCRIIRRTFRNGIPRIESNKVAAAIKKQLFKKTKKKYTTTSNTYSNFCLLTDSPFWSEQAVYRQQKWVLTT